MPALKETITLEKAPSKHFNQHCSHTTLMCIVKINNVTKWRPLIAIDRCATSIVTRGPTKERPGRRYFQIVQRVTKDRAKYCVSRTRRKKKVTSRALHRVTYQLIRGLVLCEWPTQWPWMECAGTADWPRATNAHRLAHTSRANQTHCKNLPANCESHAIRSLISKSP